MLTCRQVAVLRWADPPSKESWRQRIGLRYWKSGEGPTKDCRAIIIIIMFIMGARDNVVVKALCYRPEGHGFDTR
jgi:hypothetical protein